MAIDLERQISTLSMQIDSLNTELYGYRSDYKLLKELVGDLIDFRKQFSNKNGWIPKIIDTVTANFQKDIKGLRDEIIRKFDMLPCYDFKFDNEGILRSQCRIADKKESLNPDEKEMKGI